MRINIFTSSLIDLLFQIARKMRKMKKLRMSDSDVGLLI